MNKIKKGTYFVDGSDLKIQVLNVVWWDALGFKAKIRLSNKNNGIIYENAKYFRLYWDKVSHWRFQG